ncbi:hypothetical protein GGH15_004363 [Coemansia sp. RSA 562]|nr:hypothetical protein GGH15_004363 [Coemansia sp. RSA 562]KAJ2171733.1 hypothetical protein GGH16_002699 [Coemansia sp. RSA 560]KAJ2583604.1 hypothetical protein IWW49_005256 [Coemansia sp. RSA 1797]
MTELKQRKSALTAQPSTFAQQKHRTVAHASREHRLVWWKIVIRIAATLIGLNICLSYLITETAFWGHKSKWTNWRNYIPRSQRVFTQQELAKYDGSNAELPILLAIEGDVYDVTLGRGFYGLGTTYNLFAGRDASRAFGTNCLSRKDHLTHDTRGLTEDELAGIKSWHSLFENHQRYVKMGTVELKPIDPDTPIPPPCDGAHPKPI